MLLFTNIVLDFQWRYVLIYHRFSHRISCLVFLLFLVFTFLSSFSSDTSKSTSITERQKAKMAESDQNALKVHFGNDDEALQKQRNASNE